MTTVPSTLPADAASEAPVSPEAPASSQTPSADRFVQEWRAWQASRHDWLREPLGWLSLTALHWLNEEPRRYDGVPGTWSARDGVVSIQASVEDGLRLPADPAQAGSPEDADPVDGEARISPREGAPGLSVWAGDRLLEVALRTGRVAVRIHDPRSEHLAAFDRIPTFDPDPRWVVSGRFEAYDAPRTVTTGAVVEGLEHHHTAVGEIHVRLDGRDHALVAFAGAGDGLRILLKDATSGSTSYPGGRTLSLDAPGPDGRVVLDFNRASNLPCGFTAFATCPVAPAQNVLPVAVEAGERWLRS